MILFKIFEFLVMGSLFTKTNFSSADCYMAKEDVTLWQYGNTNSVTPTSFQVKKNCKVKVIDYSTKWWEIEYQGKKGYASKFYFYEYKDKIEDHEKALWYFGTLPRNEAVDLLMQEVNTEGSYLIRYSDNVKKFVLSVKKYTENDDKFNIKHFDIYRKKDDRFYINKDEVFDSVGEIVDHLQRVLDDTVKVKLGDVCLIPYPHADPHFRHSGQSIDTWLVPITELQYDKKDPLGKGNFGVVYKGTFQRTTTVAIKQLLTKKDDATEKALQEFIHESDIMRKINHPNLVQLYAIVNDEKEGYFIVQEYVQKGDLLDYIKAMKTHPDKKEQEKVGNKRLEWCVQIARGMAHIEQLKIVHRDLAARNVLLDKFLNAKVADFGMSMTGNEEMDGEGKVMN